MALPVVEEGTADGSAIGAHIEFSAGFTAPRKRIARIVLLAPIASLCHEQLGAKAAKQHGEGCSTMLGMVLKALALEILGGKCALEIGVALVKLLAERVSKDRQTIVPLPVHLEARLQRVPGVREIGMVGIRHHGRDAVVGCLSRGDAYG